ncbi:MAG TPA: hypothetical protein DEF04_00850 [Clostridiales bacterium]|nr:hypothetical protein [Clostridiales bacterium]
MENDTLQKIDDILKRTNTDYSTAKQALEDADGDVLEAIIMIENQNKSKAYYQSGAGKGEQVFNQLKDIIAKGNATKITIKKNNDVILNLPVTAGLIGAFIAPFLSAAGITAALLAQCSVEITQADGNVVDIGQKVDQGMDAVKDAMKDVKQDASNLKDDVINGATKLKDDIASSFNKNDEDF